MRRLIIGLFTYSILINQCWANSTTQKSNKYSLSAPSEFIFESYPNEPLIPIRLLGAVKNAGLYHVPSNIKLTTLLSLAGGTNPDADLEKIVIGNDLNHSSVENGKAKSVTLDLEEVIKYGGANDYVLNSNDIVLVKNKSPFISNDSFRVISIVSVILTSLLTAVLIQDKLDDK